MARMTDPRRATVLLAGLLWTASGVGVGAGCGRIDYGPPLAIDAIRITRLDDATLFYGESSRFEVTPLAEREIPVGARLTLSVSFGGI